MESIKRLSKFWNDKRVFITGHTGFKGSWLSILLNMLGANIYGYSLRPEKNSLFLKANCKKFLRKNTYSDINDKTKLEKEIIKSKPHIIFHLAAQPLVSQSFVDPLETLKTNMIGTSNVLESIKKINSIKSVVVITTDKVYLNKNAKKSHNEEDMLGGSDPYSVSKVCAELITKSYIESFFRNNLLKNKISTARSGNVIGGGDYSENRLLPDIIKSINSKKKLIIRNPNYIRPWQHVIEPTVGYLKLAESQYKKRLLHKNPNWNFGPDKKNFVKVIDIVKNIKKKINIKFTINRNQSFFETKILKINSSKAKKYLNWHPIWDVNKSINNVIEWNDQLKKTKNAKKICEDQIKSYFK
jgi:CDP-glucose 4,6-dehydratase